MVGSDSDAAEHAWFDMLPMSTLEESSMRNVSRLVAVFAAATLVGCDATTSLSPKAMNPGTVMRQAVVGDVVSLKLPAGAQVGTVFIVRSYTPYAEPFTCSTEGASYMFVGAVEAVAPGYTTGGANSGGNSAGIYPASMHLAPNMKLRVDSSSPAVCSGSYIQATVVQ